MDKSEIKSHKHTYMSYILICHILLCVF
uniref:Uncharacterized protein n=1 Tax=Anguilla anguilla TaxID=7936 RepID=A0A0E9V4U3_ANGAN